MKKIIFISINILIASIWLFWYSYYKNIITQKTTIKENKVISENKIISNELKKINKKEENKVIISQPIVKTQDEKIETLRKRFTLRWTIARWDDPIISNQLILALNEYQKAFKQNPKDEQIIKKLALTYFELKRFSNAVEEFSKIEKFLNKEDLNKYILSLIYLTNYESEENIKIILDKINSLNLSDEEKFYYTNVVNSVVDFHLSKKNFEDYFSNNPNLTFQNLINIKNAITNYNNFQINDIYYKDALIIWTLFSDKIFSVSNILAEKLLDQKPEYKPMLLILWKWYYELWELENAKKYLEIYYKLEPKNNSITYMLWILSFKLHDYITSNLYYNAALKNWFEPKIEIERKLAYNYYLLWDKRLMLNMFSYLLNEENSTIDDFSLWIYQAILEWRTLDATSRSEKWLKKFSWTTWYEIFYAYLWWINRENKDFEKSREYLTTWLKINPKNPLLTLNMWYLEEFEEKYKLALIYFKRTININWDWEFWELAKKEVLEIEKYLEKLENKSNSWIIDKQ